MIGSASLNSLFEQALVQVSDERIREELELIRQGKDTIVLDLALTKELDEDETLGEEETQTLSGKIRDMGIPEKIKLAMLGNSVARGLLIRDPNWMVASFVLSNPKITDGEIHDFAKNANLDELVFRSIAKKSAWMKNYSVKQAIVSNPKTPVDISIKWLKFLKDKDLKNLAKSKGIPQVIASQCKKLIEKRSKK